MLTLITKLTSAIAKTSAHRPIHFIIITSLLVSIAYLAVVDDYIPENLRNSNYSTNYYQAPGSWKNNEWTRIDDLSTYPDATQFSVVPLRFRKSHHFSIPQIKDTFEGLNENERILITRTEDLETTLDSIDKISFEGITWKARHNNMISSYYNHLRTGFSYLKLSIQGAENFDIGLIFVAYLSMWYTLIKVFIDMRQVGSKFWLAFSTITSSTFGFIFALYATTRVLDSKVPLLSITEGIPFLVAIIGFKHKISIASMVMKDSTTSTEVKSIVANAISAHTVSLLRDHLVVIGALLSCAVYAPHLEGLKNFCILSALILAFDLLLVYTFFSAILGLKVEINRARRTDDLRKVLEEDGISELVANKVATRSAILENSADSLKFENNSIVSLKVALIAAFIVFHVFWLGSSWLYKETGDESFGLFNSIPDLNDNITSNIKTGKYGTIITIHSPNIYVPMGRLVQVEDFIYMILETISHAIKDSIISKFLLFGFAISICTNAYFLNASRYQVSATNKLIEKEFSRPRISNLNTKSTESRRKSIETKNVDSDSDYSSDGSTLEIQVPKKLRNLNDCTKFFNEGRLKELNDNEVSTLVVAGKLPLYALEKQLGDNTRAVAVRRKAIAKLADAPVLDTSRLPYKHYDYDRVFGACCENVIGYMPLPVGVAGPLIIDEKPYHIPMATTEGCLVASTMRGCKALNAGGGVETVLTKDGMTRGPCVSFPSLKRAGAAKIWLDSEEGSTIIKKAFNSTSRFARLQNLQTALAGKLLFIRFRTTTGDAMGMNMISKGVEHSLKYMTEECGWDDMQVISLSGNYCTDKKAAAINWIEGRGKSIVAAATVPGEVVRKVLKSDVEALVELNTSKNLIGSAMAGSVGGFNAQAANLVTAVYLACGQDPAQNVESSNCITLMKKVGDDLEISVSMPSIEVGTIGGGTILEPQGAMLDLLGVRGAHQTNPGDNARQLAKIVASAVLAAELSLCAALAAGHLVQSHMQHNRKAAAPTTAAQKELTNSDVNRLKEGSVNCIRS